MQFGIFSALHKAGTIVGEIHKTIVREIHTTIVKEMENGKSFLCAFKILWICDFLPSTLWIPQSTQQNKMLVLNI